MELLEGLTAPDELVAVRAQWEGYERGCDMPPAFLFPENLRGWRVYAGLPDSLDGAIQGVAARIRSSPGLATLVLQAYWAAFVYRGGIGRLDLEELPRLREELADAVAIASLLLGLAWVPLLQRSHHALGVPERITRDTAAQVACYAWNYRFARGREGAFGSQIAWLRNYLHGNLYLRIGRFEYWLRPANLPCTVFRSRRGHRTVALSAPGLHYTGDGYLERQDPGQPAHETWVSEWREDESTVTGNPIHPRGHALRAPVTLPRAEWRSVFASGSESLNLHIPSGGQMELEGCIQSFKSAVEVFRGLAPQRRPVAIETASWIFAPELEHIMGRDSNLARFQRELYLYPRHGDPREGPWFVFYQRSFDPATAPRATRLQRAIRDHLAAGGKLHGSTGMFFLIEDLERLGSEYYLSRWAPAGLRDQ